MNMFSFTNPHELATRFRVVSVDPVRIGDWGIYPDDEQATQGDDGAPDRKNPDRVGFNRIGGARD